MPSTKLPSSYDASESAMFLLFLFFPLYADLFEIVFDDWLTC